MTQTNKCVFGAITFFAKKQAGEICGSNGLPVTPNSTAIYGKSQILKTVYHPNLCEYINIVKGKHEKIIVISEFHDKNVGNSKPGIDDIKKIAHDVLSGLACLNEKGIVNRSLSPESILVTLRGDYKLFNYGFYYMTNCGSRVAFPVGLPKYLPPEVFITADTSPCNAKCDVWSLGIILAEIALGKTLWNNLKLPHLIRKVLSLIHSPGTIFERLANEHNCEEIYKNLDPKLKVFLNSLLKINLEERPMPFQCLENEFFEDFKQTPDLLEDDYGYHVGFLQRVSKDNAMITKQLKEAINAEVEWYDPKDWPARELAKRSLKERYFFWQLAGGDAYSELKKQGMVKSKPSILSLPNVVILEGTTLGEIRDSTCLLDLRVIKLSMANLESRVAQMSFSVFHPLLESKSLSIPPDLTPDARFLPLIIREKDIEYQLYRVILFQRLLEGYPSNRTQIIKEAEKDVTPFYRGDIWAALLGVVGDVNGRYAAIDKETPSHTDRQIDVDIPRCHQYNDLLASPTGHRKLKRILKAWVISHPQYVYWQGLDSLCAPFLYLNFNNEAQAYACVSAFIPKYLNDFFLKDNSAVIQEYLAKFKHLVAYHDPELACHLDSIHFIPELFAIPWFLTVFSHVFPLHKILYLWDQLLLGDASFPFHVGLAILHQLRDTLLSSGFNECILLFSDLPDVDIEKCVRASLSYYKLTPRSILYRTHERQPAVSDPLLDMSPVSLSKLQVEFCPRISAFDVLILLQTPERVLVVDIRNVEEFAIQSVPNSVNLPFNLISLSDYQMPSSREGRQVEVGRGKVMVVVSSGGENLTEFCKWFVQCGFPHVCILHGGIQVLRSADVLQ